jgi:hypothetical protein
MQAQPETTIAPFGQAHTSTSQALLTAQAMSGGSSGSFCGWRQVPDQGSQRAFLYNDFNCMRVRFFILAGASFPYPIILGGLDVCVRNARLLTAGLRGVQADWTNSASVCDV